MHDLIFILLFYLSQQGGDEEREKKKENQCNEIEMIRDRTSEGHPWVSKRSLVVFDEKMSLFF